MIRHRGGQIQSAEPPMGQVQMHLVTESPLGPDSHHIADKKHPDHQLRIDRWAACRTSERGEVALDARQFDKPIYPPQHVIPWDMVLNRKLVEQRTLRFLLRTHHR